MMEIVSWMLPLPAVITFTCNQSPLWKTLTSLCHNFFYRLQKKKHNSFTVLSLLAPRSLLCRTEPLVTRGGLTMCGSVIHCLFSFKSFKWILNQAAAKTQVSSESTSPPISWKYRSSTYLRRSNSSKCFSHSNEQICGGGDKNKL